MIRTVGKWLLWTLAGLLVAAAAIVFWLRYEFARVQSQPELPAQFQVAPQKVATDLPPAEDCEEQHPLRKAYFGALHVHTGVSYDATAFGVVTTPEQAYAFARGKALPMVLRDDTEEDVAPVVSISSPLDFMAVTDHAEALGETVLCYTPGSPAYDKLVCRLYRGDIRLPVEDHLQSLVRLATHAVFGQDRSARVCGTDGSLCREWALRAWRDNQQATEAALDRSAQCQFTSFHGYEYTLAEEASNLHRNVIFASDTVPTAPLSAKDAPQPQSLWRWLDDYCISGDDQCDAMAIPHNSNWSSGRMWYPITRNGSGEQAQQSLAALRSRVELLAEIMQVKGDSECRNGIASVFGAPDEFCDFEKLRAPSEPVEDCGEEFSSGNMMMKGCISRFSFVRYALSAGLEEQRKLGVNPFKLGIVAATDTHIGMPMAGRERDNPGSHGNDRNIQHRLLGRVDVPGGIASGSPVRYNPGGLAGVYAVENSRDALFAAMRNRETFGTSGPRIQPRFFAATELPADLCDSPDYLAQAYAQGVPMGGDIEPGLAQSPHFLVSASADPRPGAHLLQRIQIVKGWVDAEGRTQQAVYDVAGDAEGLASVDKNTCEVSGPGFVQLCATWQDPDFDPNLGAVYYSRVLENPSCRWSHYDCLSLPAEERPASCSNPSLAWRIQERAWTSPIWYHPRD